MTVQTTRALCVAQIPVGAAYEEGRAPSHDGEYITVLAVAGDWFAEGNSGLIASSVGDNFRAADLEQTTQSQAASDRLDDAADDAASSLPNVKPGQKLQVGNELGDALVAQGWATEVDA